MFDTEKLSKKIGEKIASEINLDKDNKEVISYGIFAIIQMTYNILLVIVFGMIFNVVVQALIVSFVVAVLRKSSGGAHASSASRCAVIGTFTAVILGLLSKINLDSSVILLIEILTFIWGYYIIFTLAPVDNPTKPIKTDKKKKRLKKSSIIIFSIYLIFIILNNILYTYMNIDRVLSYSMCIIYGVIWQLLSLTKLGHVIVEFMDAFLNIILTYKIGGENNEKTK